MYDKVPPVGSNRSFSLGFGFGGPSRKEYIRRQRPEEIDVAIGTLVLKNHKRVCSLVIDSSIFSDRVRRCRSFLRPPSPKPSP